MYICIRTYIYIAPTSHVMTPGIPIISLLSKSRGPSKLDLHMQSRKGCWRRNPPNLSHEYFAKLPMLAFNFQNIGPTETRHSYCKLRYTNAISRTSNAPKTPRTSSFDSSSLQKFIEA